MLKTQLWAATSQDAEAWQKIQAMAAYDKGVAQGIRYVVDIEFEDLEQDKPKEKE